MNTAISKNLQKPLSTSYALLACCLTLFTLYLCYAIQWRGPFRDLWEFIGLIQDQLNDHWDMNALIEPYGGIHRIFLPRLLFYLDYRFASGSNFLAMSVTIALHMAACCLLIRSVLNSPNINKEDAGLLIATTLLFWFSTTQIYNLIYISDNQVVIGNSLSVFSAALFCLYLQNKKLIYLYAMNVVILLACLSHGSSLMIWPAIIFVMFLNRQSIKTIIFQLFIAAIIFGLYVSGHDPLDHSGVSMPLWKRLISSLYNFLINAPGILRYIGLHLSSPTSRDYPLSGTIISYLSVFYLLHISYRVYKKRWQLNNSEIFWITLACYGLLIAVITAYGRQIYPNSALTDRYQTLVMTYWVALMALLYSDLKKQKPALVFLIPVLSLLLLLPYQYKNAEEMAWLSSRVTIAHTAAIVGITDMDSVAATLSHPLLMSKNNLVAVHNDFLRHEHLAYFSDDDAQYFWNENINKPFPETIEINPNCGGDIFSIEKISGARNKNNPEENFKFSGQGHTDHQVITENVLVMDGERHIIGLGRNHRAKGAFLPLALRNAGNEQWTGFIHSPGKIIYPLTFLGKSIQGYCSLFTKTTLEM